MTTMVRIEADVEVPDDVKGAAQFVEAIVVTALKIRGCRTPGVITCVTGIKPTTAWDRHPWGEPEADPGNDYPRR